VTTTYPAITQLPLPPALTGLSVTQARRALTRQAGLRDACLSGLAGAEIQAWACTYAISQLHADHLVTTVIAVAAASQADKLTPDQAWARLRDAVNLGDRPELLPLDECHNQLPDEGPQASVQLDPDPDLLPRFITDVLARLAPAPPSAAIVTTVTQAAIVAETILGQHRLSLPGLGNLDEDAAANAIRTIAREWPASLPAAARWLVAGTTSRSASAVSRITLGPVTLALGPGITAPDPRTLRRWTGWYRSLANAQPITQRIAA